MNMNKSNREFKEKIINVLKGREVIYSFLARVYEKEIDEGLLKDFFTRREMFLKYHSIPDLDVNIKNGFKDLFNYLNKLNKNNIDNVILELAVDYANLFLGIKYIREKSGIPHPSESVYMSGYMFQNERDQVLNMYLEAGIVKSPDFKEPEDHVSLELYFMAYLCRKALEFIKKENFKESLKFINMQKKFFSDHLVRWVPKLADDVIKYAETDFYKAIGRITKGLLNMESKTITNLIKLIKDISAL